ncbi:sterol desaturase family protein [Solitalea sp. MAHUQ-68]|uniref:Sterol desaturase family protein n=1 Tax=Solitalea agri TaxID=2953739 RepID=A0A9X2F620_9SPHI|nr:sterol desaturase family protein [Solitalea agri]MCO4292548.1 sterol desaturase family protein [Solitalea agri]
MESIALALPVLLLAIGIEYYVAKRKKLAVYKFNDTVSNLSIGILDRVAGLLTAGFFFFVYDFLHQRFAIINIQQNWVSWVLLFLLVDFLWYWYHRSSHEINLFWAVHVIHHSSEEFNYSVGTRITIFQSLARLLFWAILPIIGFPALMIMPVLLIQGVYPFFVHTQLIGKLGWIEYILVTPSHHRVHHGNNETYLDKNYGGFFIIWDRMFGTYAEETEEVRYGLTHQLQTNSLLWQFFHFFLELYYAAKLTKGFGNKLKVLFGGPEQIDPSIREQLELIFLSRSKRLPLAKKFKTYVVVQLIFIIMVLIAMLYFYNQLNLLIATSVSLIILITLINCGAILEQKKWVFNLEFARFLLASGMIAVFTEQPLIWLVVITLTEAVLVNFSAIKRSYMKGLKPSKKFVK